MLCLSWKSFTINEFWINVKTFPIVTFDLCVLERGLCLIFVTFGKNKMRSLLIIFQMVAKLLLDYSYCEHVVEEKLDCLHWPNRCKDLIKKREARRAQTKRQNYVMLVHLPQARMPT